MDPDVSLVGPHLSVQDLAAYLDRPSGPARACAEAHLALCDRCLCDLIAVGRVLRELGEGTR